MRTLSLLLLVLSLKTVAFGQAVNRPDTKFGNVKPEDFAPAAYAVDSQANAVVLFDLGKAEYGTDLRGGFSIIYKFHQRIRLMNKNGFDAATVEIPVLKATGIEEILEKVEATTYNLEGDKVVATKVDKSSIFKDKLSKDYQVQKFTFPNLKEGCIIEYTYTISSPFTRYLHEWNFQGDHPVLWSEYDVMVPSLYNFVIIKQGYFPYAVEKSEVTSKNYSVYVPASTAYEKGQNANFNFDVYHTTWAMENVPSLKEEEFTTTLENHVARVSFQLRSIHYPDRAPQPQMGTWFQVAEELMKDEDFGKALTDNNGWLSDDVKRLTASAATQTEKAKKIFEFVRDNFTCTDASAIFLTSPLKKVFESKKGAVSDLNLLLAAMLKKAGFEVQPLLLSTRAHGRAYEEYPVMERLNYVIVRAKVDDNYTLLDASDGKMGYGKLPIRCYNGGARIIDAMPELVQISPDSLRETKITSVFIMNSEDKKGLQGSFTSNLGQYESYSLRHKLAKQTSEEFFKEVKKNYSFDVDIKNPQTDNLTAYEQPITLKYDFTFSLDEDILYVNPMLAEATKENPFKSARRYYPVEMPFVSQEIYVLDMEIPEGYVVDELPKSSRILFNENEGMFEYLISSDGKNIRLRSKISLNKATFDPEDYESLREFFAFIVKKHSEQIVLKKK
jgi:hypothetical protein